MYQYGNQQYQTQQIVDLSDQSITDVSLESRLKHFSPSQVYQMRLKDNPITNVEPIIQFIMLRYLDLSGTNIVNASGLSKLANLEVLYLNTTQIEDISFLKSLTKLRELYLTDTSIVDIEAIGDLSELRILSIAGTNIGNNISILSKLNNLVEVYLMNTKIDSESLTSLRQLPHLNNLFVDDELESTKNYILSEVKLKSSKISFNSDAQSSPQTSNPSEALEIPEHTKGITQQFSLEQIKELINGLNESDKTSLKEWFNKSPDFKPQVRV